MSTLGKSILRLITIVIVCAAQTAMGLNVLNSTPYNAWVTGVSDCGNYSMVIKAGHLGSRSVLGAQALDCRFTEFIGVLAPVPGDPSKNIQIKPLRRSQDAPSIPKKTIVIEQRYDGFYGFRE